MWKFRTVAPGREWLGGRGMLGAGRGEGGHGKRTVWGRGVAWLSQESDSVAISITLYFVVVFAVVVMFCDSVFVICIFFFSSLLAL